MDGAYVGSVNAQSTSDVYKIGNDGGGGYNWGPIDDFRVYTRALSAAEIASLYAGTNPSGQWATGKIGGAVTLMTGAATITSPSTSALNTDTHTIAFWLRFNSTPSGWGSILTYNPSSTNLSPGILAYPGSNCLYWTYDPSRSYVGGYCLGPAGVNTYFTTGTWYHVVGVKNGATFTLYVNGTSVASGTVSNPKTAGNAPIILGDDLYTAAPVSLDDLRIYNRALSAEEVGLLAADSGASTQTYTYANNGTKTGSVTVSSGVGSATSYQTAVCTNSVTVAAAQADLTAGATTVTSGLPTPLGTPPAFSANVTNIGNATATNFPNIFQIATDSGFTNTIGMVSATTIASLAGNSASTGITGTYAAASKVIFLTSGTSSWTVPADWNSANNKIEAIGAGGSSVGTSGVYGGGGGAYAKITNLALTPGAVIPVQIGAGGGAVTTQFRDSSTLVADYGRNGTASINGAGGTVANSVGSVKYKGGDAGSWVSDAPGGGGAAGPNGAGGNGGSSVSSGGWGASGGGGGADGGATGGSPAAAGSWPQTVGPVSGAGGNGGGGSGGGAAAPGGGGTSETAVSNGSNGTAGTGGGGSGGGSGYNGGGSWVAGRGGNGASDTAFDSTHGAGGGGGGSGARATASGNGGNYGGGAGAFWGSAGGSGGTGGAGLIVITYTPVLSTGSYYVRACANNNTSWAGGVPESNTGNDCGAATLFSIGTPITASGGGNVSCSVSPTTGHTTDSFVWTASGATGGNGGPYTYTWNDNSEGTPLNGLTNTGVITGNTASQTVTGYAINSNGYDGSVTVSDSAGDTTGVIPCYSRISSVTALPIVNLYVNAGSTISGGASSVTINKGSSITFSWSSTNATSCTAIGSAFPTGGATNDLSPSAGATLTNITAQPTTNNPDQRTGPGGTGLFRWYTSQ